MNFDDNRQLCDVFHRHLDRLDWRAHVVYLLLESGRYREACQCALPLIGTPYNGLFLYVRAWQYFFEGFPTESSLLLRRAYAFYLKQVDPDWQPEELSFDERGLPRLSPIFRHPALHDARFTKDTLEYKESMTRLRNLPRKVDVGRLTMQLKEKKAAYLRAFAKLVPCLEQLLHCDSTTLEMAVDEFRSRRKGDKELAFLLRLALVDLDESPYKTMKEALWRVAADWNYPLELCQLLCMAAWFKGDDAEALDFAARGLETDPVNLVCGMVRGLVLDRTGRKYLADEQWRECMGVHSQRAPIYLVLGCRAFAEGADEVALRYFHEARATGESTREVARLLRAFYSVEDA